MCLVLQDQGVKQNSHSNGQQQEFISFLVCIYCLHTDRFPRITNSRRSGLSLSQDFVHITIHLNISSKDLITLLAQSWSINVLIVEVSLVSQNRLRQGLGYSSLSINQRVKTSLNSPYSSCSTQKMLNKNVSCFFFSFFWTIPFSIGTDKVMQQFYIIEMKNLI